MRHHKALSCEENREFLKLMSTPKLPAKEEMGNPLKLPENQWMNVKEAEMRELDKMLGISRRHSSPQVAVHPHRMMSEDVSEFEEPHLRQAPHQPATAAQRYPTSFRSGESSFLPSEPNYTQAPIFTKSQLSGADDEF
jgi:hypothetical protein